VSECLIRPMREHETGQVAGIWYRAGRAAYTYLPGWQQMTPELAQQVFRDHIAAHCQVFVVEHQEAVAGYLALKGSYVDRLYIDPGRQGLGLGTALIEHVRALCPDGLELHTHQQNVAACAFYERLGFVAVRYGLSPPPESAPDVEYHWRP
jgi:ribosomal protein S18 acetylase RimI-like enzyme